MDQTPPGKIIDGDIVHLGEDAVGDVLELQGLSTLLLTGRTIVRCATMGTDAVFAVELDDGSRFQCKMLSFDPPREKKQPAIPPPGPARWGSD